MSFAGGDVNVVLFFLQPVRHFISTVLLSRD